MPTKKAGSNSSWVDPDAAPRLTAERFQVAEIREGDRIVRPARPVGRPRLENAKTAISIRLDADVVEHFRKTGPGWQSRINQALRKAMGRTDRKAQ